MFKPTYLYVKIHNQTGLRYFGKTTRDPFKYLGSGVYWSNHLKKHGKDIFTIIIGYYEDEEECKKIALKFSREYNIVESKEWANQVEETGIDNSNGVLSEGIKKKISDSNKGRTSPNKGVSHSEETIVKISIRTKSAMNCLVVRQKMKDNHQDFSGENNPMFGKHHSEETKQKMKDNHQDFSGENHPQYGVPKSELTRKKISDKAKNRRKIK